MNPRQLVLGALLVLCPLVAHAASRTSRDGLWTDVDKDSIAGQQLIVPKAFRTVTLDLAAFHALASEAPLEGTSAVPPVMTVPMPDGSFASFAIEESPIVDKQLAAEMPDVKTYRATGIDDPAATGRLDVTQFGFHGMILSPAGTLYIDPYRLGDTAHYISYWRRDYERAVAIEPFHCNYAQENASRRPVAVSAAGKKLAAALAANGATLRTYRLALACTGEYAQFFGGTVSNARAAMITTINRVNAIYQKEVAVRLEMVANSAICFTNPSADPYSNTDSDLSINQSTIDLNIGSANYDIGHLLGTGGGGLASLGVVCVNGLKARGLTGSSSPVGDAFDVDYVAHEMGHQFDADHTFNGTTSNCGGGNRYGPAAYEVGSGSTIMAYAGICGAEDLQPHSDAYFHGKSFDQIVSFIAGTSCAVQSATANDAPSVNAGPAVTIPMSTPFYLTGSATDPNGDALTYCWEEFDLGNPGPPNTDNGNRPIFRSFNPVSAPVRTFPKLSDLQNNVASLGESLPITTRTMAFRLTARDGKGGVNYAATTVNVTTTSGPFTVTSPNTFVSWTGNSTQTVTWNVAGTNNPPVSCASVKILLSTDNGLTFPTTILASTPNDGAQAITVPNITTSAARLRVECTSQPFFDISNSNFAITTVMTVAATATSPTSVAVSWNAIPDAIRYDVFRRTTSGTVLAGSTLTPGFNDSSLQPGTAYLYTVNAFDKFGIGTMSAPDLATTVLFTDPTLAPLSTVVKAAHINELRTAVNAVRTLAFLPEATFSDPTLVPGFLIATAHITDLRAALAAARSALSLPPASYEEPSLTAGATIVRAAHVEEVRAGVR